MIDELEPELDLVGAILQAIAAKLETVWTALPARITAVQSGGRVTVEPTVLAPSGTRLPSVSDVRVVQPLAGSRGLGLPVAAGTEGLLLVCTLDPHGWMLRGAVVASDKVRHALSYAVFLPGVGPGSPSAPSKPTLGDLTHASHPVALGDRLTQILTVLDTALRTPAPGETSPGYTALQSAWVAAFPVALPSVSSTDAEVTSV